MSTEQLIAARTAAPAHITISRAERDALWPEIGYLAPGDEPSHALEDREKALKYRADFDLAVAMYDQLGWAKDDPRESFDLTIEAASLRDALTRERANARDLIEDNRVSIAKARTGNPGHWFDGMNEQQTVEHIEKQIERDQRTVDVCDAILERLGDAWLAEGGRVVPIRFEDYLATRGARDVESQECSGCRRPGGRWHFGANVYCEPCAQYQHGFDQAEEKMVRNIIAAAIAAARDAGARDELVRAAVDDAFSERVHIDAFGVE